MTLFGLLIILLLPSYGLSSDLESRADAIVSIFENGTPIIQYQSIVDIKDGRGYTAGKAGFTTATSDLLEVVKRYLKIKPKSAFSVLENILEERSRTNSGSIVGLSSLPIIWKEACDDHDFIVVQDQLVEDWYKAPARKAIKRYQLHTNLAYVIFYDSFIQHGDGEDPDSFFGIIKKMSYHGNDEKKFLVSFLKARLMILKNPADHESRDAWRESVDRVHALERLMIDNKWDLKPPFKLKIWNDSFSF